MKNVRKKSRWHPADTFEESRALFRDAAHAMIRSGSVASLSMRGLALEVGASPMTTYRYYHDKDALIADVRKQVWREFTAQLNRSVEGIADAPSIFRTMALTYLRYAVDHEQEYRLMFDGPRPVIPSGGAGDALDMQAWALLRDLVTSIVGRKDEDRSSQYAHLIWSSLHGLVTLHHSGRLSLEGGIDEVGPPIISLLLDAVQNSAGSA